MPRTLHVVSLGGTIASARPRAHSEDGPGDHAAGGVTPQISGEEIAASARLTDLIDGTEIAVTFDQVAQAGGPNITLRTISDVVDSCRRARQEHGAEAAILTQGTDSLEETAFSLSLLNNSGIPIAVTGAMRHPELPGADGPANVRAAALTALTLAGRSDRVPAVLVIDDEIHDPWFVRKAHTTSPGAFTSGPVLGGLGWVGEDRVFLPHRPIDRHTPVWESVPDHQHVIAIIEAGSGDRLEILDHLRPADTDGVIIAGLGGGHVAADAAERIGRLAERMPVVVASRTGAGATLRNTYAWVGGDIDLRRRGIISAGLLDARKARIVLALCLADERDPREVFERHFAG